MEQITTEDERTLSEATANKQIMQEAIFSPELTIENQDRYFLVQLKL